MDEPREAPRAQDPEDAEARALRPAAPETPAEGRLPFFSGLVSRRRLLKLGLAGGGVLLAGGSGLLAVRGAAPEATGLKVLSDHQYLTLAALARTHLPQGGPFPEGADDFDLARAFDAFLADEPERNVRDLGLALTLVELGPVLFDRRLTTFPRLSPEAQLVHWERHWTTSRSLLRRKAATAFRKFLALVFYDQPEVWPRIGYPGPGVGR